MEALSLEPEGAVKLFRKSSSLVCTKEKIEEKSLRLPNILWEEEEATNKVVYMSISEFDTMRVQHLAEELEDRKVELGTTWKFWEYCSEEYRVKAKNANVNRKLYKIRDKELVKIAGQEFEAFDNINKHTRATIVVFTDTEANARKQSYIDIMGMVDEVESAEEAIIKKILENYGEEEGHPVLLMPPVLYEDHLVIKKNLINKSKILRIEVDFACWIKVERDVPPGGSDDEWWVKLFGPKDHVRKAVRHMKNLTDGPPAPAQAAQAEAEPAEATDELEQTPLLVEGGSSQGVSEKDQWKIDAMYF